VKKLKFVGSGFEAGQLMIVQLRSISMLFGAVGTTFPSTTPFGKSEHDDAWAWAVEAAPSDTTSARSANPIALLIRFALSRPLRIMLSLGHRSRRSVMGRDRETAHE
jgi:hypothetical protein